MRSALKNTLTEPNYVDHYAVFSPESFSFKKVLLTLDMVTLRAVNIEVWFNSYFGFSGCYIQGLKIVIWYPFFGHVLNPEVVEKSIIL